MLALLAKYKLIAIVAAALLGVVGLGGAGVAAANGALPVALSAITGQQATTTPARAAKTTTSAKHVAFDGLTHGTVITSANGAYVTYTVDAGQVSAISTTSVTLTRLDGQTVTLAISPSTVWGKQGKAPKNPSKLQGRNVIVFSQNGTATQLGMGGEALKNAVHLDAMFVHNGKTRELQIDRGSAQSVSMAQISVKRADGVVVTEPIAVKARWEQAPNHTQVQPGNVAPGASVAIVTYNGKVIAVRVAAAS